MVRKPLANGSQTKCAHVWMRLRTCAAPSTNGSHTVCCKLKFVGVLLKHKENWMRRLSFLCTRCSLLASGLWKINLPCATYVPHANNAAHKRRTHVYKTLHCLGLIWMRKTYKWERSEYILLFRRKIKPRNFSVLSSFKFHQNRLNTHSCTREGMNKRTNVHRDQTQ